MQRKILVSGDRADFTTLEFDQAEKELRILANYTAPFNASWLEPSSSRGSADHLIGLSEGDQAGLLYTVEIDHLQKTCNVTSQQPTLGAPAHSLIRGLDTHVEPVVITLQDESALALATYLGGSIALYPVSSTEHGLTTLTDAPRTEIFPDFPYRLLEHGPHKGRQRQCHVHQVLEGRDGVLYAPDLGSDRVWILQRDKMNMKIYRWLQCPPGTGPRHAVFAPHGTILYVIGELSHTVIAFDLSDSLADVIWPVDGFSPNIIPPTVHPDHQFMMDSSEICLHPTITNVLYISNRWERHIAQREPHLPNVPETLPPGDTIAIIMLSEDGKAVESIKHVQTNVDVIRGMRLSDDGEFMVVAGQEGGGVEIYRIGGDRGDVWTLIAGLSEGLKAGLKHAIWL